MNTYRLRAKAFAGWPVRILVVVGLLTISLSAVAPPAGSPVAMIVQGQDMAAAAVAVRTVGGTITHKLGIINAVGAHLTPAQLEAIRQFDGVRLYGNHLVHVAGVPAPDTLYPTLVDASQLHDQGITGAGVTVAAIDTGIVSRSALNKTPDKEWRQLAQYDAILDRMDSSGTYTAPTDGSGHGTHVASIILSSAATAKPYKYNGIAPYANLVSVKAFDAHGAGSYADVIRGLDWVVTNKDIYGIRVLNLSFSAPPQSYYWDDPLNQAVMRAWQAGIVVVAAVGNTGPDPMTIGVPGNVPYIITVGAMSDNYTPFDRSDDILTSFSAAGPTVEGFVKPEVAAPGGHMLGIMPNEALIPQEHPEFFDGKM
jgi:serine protease AprX